MKKILFLTFLVACGTTKQDVEREDRRSNESLTVSLLQQKVLELQGSTSQITNLINSDYKTCPNAGETADALIRKICQVAQASTIELEVELTNKLAAFVTDLNDQIDAINQNLVQLQANYDGVQVSLTTINTSISSINSSLSTLGTRMTNAENAISALQTLTNSISAVVAGTMEMIEIGTENLLAGPFHESVLRRTDKTQVNGYVEAYQAFVGLGSNPMTASSGSQNVIVALVAHGYTAGDIVEFDGLVGSRGFSNGNVKGMYQIISVNTNDFTVKLKVSATSSGTLGGSGGTVRKVIGVGMGKVWATADGGDIAVRTTSAGKPYNFLVKSTGIICYDKTDSQATFATINAGPNTNVVCK